MLPTTRERTDDLHALEELWAAPAYGERSIRRPLLPLVPGALVAGGWLTFYVAVLAFQLVPLAVFAQKQFDSTSVGGGLGLQPGGEYESLSFYAALATASFCPAERSVIARSKTASSSGLSAR